MQIYFAPVTASSFVFSAIDKTGVSWEKGECIDSFSDWIMKLEMDWPLNKGKQLTLTIMKLTSPSLCSQFVTGRLWVATRTYTSGGATMAWQNYDKHKDPSRLSYAAVALLYVATNSPSLFRPLYFEMATWHVDVSHYTCTSPGRLYFVRNISLSRWGHSCHGKFCLFTVRWIPAATE